MSSSLEPLLVSCYLLQQLSSTTEVIREMLQFPCRLWLCIGSSLFSALNVDLPWLGGWILILLFCCGARTRWDLFRYWMSHEAPFNLLFDCTKPVSLSLRPTTLLSLVKLKLRLFFLCILRFSHCTGSMSFACTKGSFVPSKIQDEDAVINYVWTGKCFPSLWLRSNTAYTGKLVSVQIFFKP